MLSTLRSSVSPMLEPLKPHVQHLQDWASEHPRLTVGALAAFATTAYIASSAAARLKNFPPGPTPLPFIGSRHLLDYKWIHESLNELGKKYGDVFTIYVYSQPFIILNSYSAIKEGFVTDRHLMAGRPYVPDYLEAMNEEVFMGDFSDHWKMAKTTGITALKKFAGPQSEIEPIMQEEVDFLIDTFTRNAGTPMRLKPTFLKVTGNLMSYFMYGQHYDDHDNPELLNVLRLVDNWYKVVNGICPWDQFDPAWLMRLQFKEEHKLFVETCAEMRDHCQMIMDRVKDNLDPEQPTSFLEYFLVKRDMEPMGGLEGFKDTINLYIVDPVDTMAVLLQWCVLYLAYFPDVQAQLRKAIEEVVGTAPRVTMEHRGHLGLVESFLHEVQRHCDFTVISFPHTCSRPGATFRGYNLPQDAMIYANFHAAHRDPQTHPNPEQFQADRFVDKSGQFKKGDAVFTFSAGARSCPGDIHTRMELFLVIANLVHRFNIKFPEGQEKPELKMQAKFFFKIPHDFQVIFTPR